MMDPVKIKLQEQALNAIRDRLSLTQTEEAKENTIITAFRDFCSNLPYKMPEAQATGYLQNEKEKERFLEELENYGIISSLLDDPDVEDIIINGTEPIYAHYSKDGLRKTNKRFESLPELELLIKKILVFGGKQELRKINNVDLLGMRGRANIVYSPLGPELTITKIKINPLSIIDLIDKGTLNSDMAALLWLYIEGLGMRAANILVSGGPGAGKTTLLNALLSFIPSDQHIVVIEDSMELVTNWIGSTSRLESDENLTLADLVKNSLRMRPERIIVGEVRGEEAQDMITAMNIGKYCMGTIHASTVRELILRLQSNPMNVPEILINLVDVFIVMKKINTNQCITRVIDEITESAGLEQKIVLLSYLWKFDSAISAFSQLSYTNVYRDRLAKASGLSGKQILDEINKRKNFLERLRHNKVTPIADVASMCELYIKSPQLADSAIDQYKK